MRVCTSRLPTDTHTIGRLDVCKILASDTRCCLRTRNKDGEGILELSVSRRAVHNFFKYVKGVKKEVLAVMTEGSACLVFVQEPIYVPIPMLL